MKGNMMITLAAIYMLVIELLVTTAALHNLDMDSDSSGQQLPVDRDLHPGCSDIFRDDSGRDHQYHEPSKVNIGTISTRARKRPDIL